MTEDALPRCGASSPAGSTAPDTKHDRAPRLLAVIGQALLTGGAVAAIASPLANFFVAGNDADRGGVRVAAKDADGDTRADVVVGAGERSVSRVRVYLGKNFGGAEPATFQDVDLFGSAVFADGVFVG